MMKLLLFFLISAPIYAQGQNILHCLGQEELKLHKKKVDSSYIKLNRGMISSILQFRNSIKIDHKKTKEICESKHPSIHILKEVIVNTSKNLFYTKYSSKNSPKEYAMDKATLDEFESNSYKLFLNYIFSVQARLDSESCLKRKIPQLNLFFTKMSYTLEEEGIKKIFEELKNPKLIFNVLSDIESGDISCEESEPASKN